MATETTGQTSAPGPLLQRVKVGVLHNEVDRRRTTEWRFWSQVFWAGVCVFIGWQFYRFVAAHEAGAALSYPARPAGVEGFLPISGLMGCRDWVANGVLNNIHPAATILILLAVVISLVWKKSFCGWVCPVGLLSESVGAVGKRVLKWRHRLPRWIDIPLRGVKYLLLFFFVLAVFVQMTPASLSTFIGSPYNRVADIKMLKFFTVMDTETFWYLTGLVIAGFLMNGFWCRYLCPYGALVGFLSLVSPFKIRRHADKCVDCDACNQSCWANLPVSSLKTVRSDECNSCLACIDHCPEGGALDYSLPKGRSRLRPVWVLVLVTAIYGGGILVAKVSGGWDNAITPQEYQFRINELNHPKYNHARGSVPEYGPQD